MKGKRSDCYKPINCKQKCKNSVKPEEVISLFHDKPIGTMLIILSPAKSMDMNPVANAPAGTKPQFQSDAEFIASKMQEYSRDQLQILLQISNKHYRYQL